MPDRLTKDRDAVRTAFIILASALSCADTGDGEGRYLTAEDVVIRAASVAEALAERGHFDKLIAYMGGKVPGIES